MTDKHTPKGETVCPGCGTTWVSDNPSVGFESSAEGSFPSRNAAACPTHAAAQKMLKALEHTRITLDNIMGDSELLETYLPLLLKDVTAAIKAAKGDAS